MSKYHSRKRSKYRTIMDVVPGRGKTINLDRLRDDDDDIFSSATPSALDRLTGALKRNSVVGPKGLSAGRKHKMLGPWTVGGPPKWARRRKSKAPRYFPPAPYLESDSGPEPKDKEINSLWACHSVMDVGKLAKKWDRKFLGKWQWAIKRRKLEPEMRNMIELLLNTSRATTVPILTNTKVGNTARKHFHEGLVASVAAETEIEVALVTFISGDWATSHSKPVIELQQSQKLMQSTLRAMAPNYFGVTELALFNSHPHPDGGQIVQVHGHALIWGVNILSNAQKVAAKHMGRFTANFTNAPQIDVRRVRTDAVNLARVSAYLFKPPHRAMTWCPPRDGKKGHMHQSEKGDRAIRYLRLAEIRSLLTFEDICFASGEGQTIKSGLTKLLRATSEADAGGDRRPMHPDAIASFWAGVAKALGKIDWEVPVVKRRK